MPNQRKTHCPKGHGYTVENTRWIISDGYNKPYQECKACRQARRNRQQKLRYHANPAYRQRRRDKTTRWRAKKSAAHDNV